MVPQAQVVHLVRLDGMGPMELVVPLEKRVHPAHQVLTVLASHQVPVVVVIII